ncbi:hypothetical protein S245_071560, partial [Arachis hypogaea]
MDDDDDGEVRVIEEVGDTVEVGPVGVGMVVALVGEGQRWPWVGIGEGVEELVVLEVLKVEDLGDLEGRVVVEGLRVLMEQVFGAGSDFLLRLRKFASLGGDYRAQLEGGIVDLNIDLNEMPTGKPEQVLAPTVQAPDPYEGRLWELGRVILYVDEKKITAYFFNNCYDNLSTESVAQIFRKKKPKKIGIRSEDLQDSLELLIKGCSMSLSFPRFVIPAAIYGISVLSHHYFTNDFFDFQENEESYNQSYSLLKVLQILIVEAIVGIIKSPFGIGNTANAALLSARPVFVTAFIS